MIATESRDYGRCLDYVGRLKKPVYVIEREIELGGPLSEEQRLKLLEIADKCPVARTLTSEIKIKSRLMEAGAG